MQRPTVGHNPIFTSLWTIFRLVGIVTVYFQIDSFLHACAGFSRDWCDTLKHNKQMPLAFFTDSLSRTLSGIRRDPPTKTYMLSWDIKDKPQRPSFCRCLMLPSILSEARGATGDASLKNESAGGQIRDRENTKGRT